MVHNTTFFAKLLKANPIPTNLNKLTEEAKKESENTGEDSQDKE